MTPDLGAPGWGEDLVFNLGEGVLVAGPGKLKSEPSGDRGPQGMEQMVAGTIPSAMTAGTCVSQNRIPPPAARAFLLFPPLCLWQPH